MRLVLMVAFLSVACGGVTTPRGDLSWSVTIAPLTIRAGDTATVQVVVTNRGKQRRDFYRGKCVDPWVVTTTSGTVVGPRQVGNCEAILISQTLEPDEQYTFSPRKWIGDALTGRDGQTKLLSPDTYLIRAGTTDVQLPGTPAIVNIRQ